MSAGVGEWRGMATGDDGVDGGGGTDTNANRGNIEDAESAMLQCPQQKLQCARPRAYPGALACTRMFVSSAATFPR